MATKPKSYVLDTWSILSFLEGESGGEKISNLLSDANEQNIPIFMTAVNIGELWYLLAREISGTAADQNINDLSQLGIQSQPVDWKLANHAARFKAGCKLSFTDCFAAALTFQNKGSVLVTGNKEFKELEESIKIHWLV